MEKIFEILWYKRKIINVHILYRSACKIKPFLILRWSFYRENKTKEGVFPHIWSKTDS